MKYLSDKGADDAEIAKKMRGEIIVKMQELKKISAYGKLNEAKEFIKEVIESGEKLIVFVIHHVIVDELIKEFPEAVTVTEEIKISKNKTVLMPSSRIQTLNLLFAI